MTFSYYMRNIKSYSYAIVWKNRSFTYEFSYKKRSGHNFSIKLNIQHQLRITFFTFSISCCSTFHP